MSGDVQPRKRKDKRRKKDASSSERSKAEAEYIARKLSLGDDSDEGGAPVKTSSASHFSSEGDSVIHVDHEGGTGGHWCAKIIFFILLGVLVGLIGLIILENRGLTDVDTPAGESRFAQVFDGWIDEGPAHDDHHDEHTLELTHGDDEHEDEFDEEHDEEIEDIEDESHEHDDEDDDEHGSDDEEDHSQEEDHDDEEDDHDDELNDEADEEPDDYLETAEDDDNNDGNDDDENYENNDIEEAEEQDNEDDNQDDDDDDYLNASPENDSKDDDDDDDEDDNESKLKDSQEDDKFLPFEEVDSVEEEVVDNTAGEDEHLAAKEAAEKLAREQEEPSGMGMRVGVGLALLVVAYCVLARKWRNASDNDESDLDLNRRMTLIPDESEKEDEDIEEEIEEEIVETKKSVPVMMSNPPQNIFGQKPKPIIHRYEEQEDEEEVVNVPIQAKSNIQLLQEAQVEPEEVIEESEGEEVEVEDEDEEDVEEITREEVKNIASEIVAEDETEDISNENEGEQPDDEDYLEEEELEGEEEEEEEDISEEVDDSDLLKKLEEKYGKLPEPSGRQEVVEENSDEEKPVTPARKRGKPSGGNAIDDSDSGDWPDDANDHWKEQLDLAQAEMDEGRIEEAFRSFTALSQTKPTCPIAKWGRAKALDALAEIKRSNRILQSAIESYQEILDMTIDNHMFETIGQRTINRMRFRGKHLDAVPVHKKFIDRYPRVPHYRNELAITYLMVNKVELSRKVLQDTLELWPEDGIALVHYGFILKTVDNNMAEAVTFMQKGIDSGANGTLEGRFLFHLGDALARLGHSDKALKIYELGTSSGVFLSPMQRSLYNVDRLTGRPWWKTEQTPYKGLISQLETNWKHIAQEARELRSQYKPEQENLKDSGDWSQYELFIRGVEVKNHCSRCPITCGIVRTEAAASGCRRGQVKFSAMAPGTHVFAHTGPTNCRLRAHLGLQGTEGTYIRVAQETRSWEKGKVFIFDDSFEHEVWHNGTSLRIVLIIDLWHPELTKEEHNSLPAI